MARYAEQEEDVLVVSPGGVDRRARGVSAHLAGKSEMELWGIVHRHWRGLELALEALRERGETA